ncbi:MAG: PIN/TRAM domain-containing protein [Trueperaceae bacterium]
MDGMKENPTLLEESPTVMSSGKVRPRWFYIVMRLLLSLCGAGLGFLVATYLVRRGWFGDPINIIYITLVGLMGAYLLSAPAATYLTGLFNKTLTASNKVPPQAVLAAIVGVTVALIMTVLLNSLLERVPGFTWYWSLLLTVLLSVGFAWFFVVNRQVFRPSLPMAPTEAATTTTESKLKLIDTSAIIDGRIADIVEANFLDGTLAIPKFVLSELQNIADSSDPLRRSRGRRGLEVLDKLIQQAKIPTQVMSDDVTDVTEVDEKLIRLCQQKNAALITTDYNLNRVAALQNVRVLNVNQLANAVRAMFLPGERLNMHIVKEGREPGQGLAYLEDGTMVVVEDGSDYVGETIDVVVTSHLQTNMGRMIFAKPHQR